MLGYGSTIFTTSHYPPPVTIPNTMHPYTRTHIHPITKVPTRTYPGSPARADQNGGCKGGRVGVIDIVLKNYISIP